MIELSTELASQLARLPLASLHRALPHKLDHVVNEPSDVQHPRALHPSFYGCFDWHSSVHGHWMLVRLLRTCALPEDRAIRSALATTLTAENLAVECRYFNAPNRQSFERTYGWAWLLLLAAELHGFADRDARQWAANLHPLADTIVQRYLDFLPKQTYPIRSGVHANTAFGLAFALDYARAVKHAALETLIVDTAVRYYGNDTDYPAAWEPSGEDFLSPALVEADLMRRVLPAADLAPWLRRFLPRGLPGSLVTPATVSDRSDPKLAHLDGLNLSRAWCLQALAAALTDVDPLDLLGATCASAAEAHAREGLAHVATGDYAGEHWLASFAVYLLGARGSSDRRAVQSRN